MQRRHFDVLISVAGIVLAVVLLVFGLYLKDQRDFAHDTVQSQLAAQRIQFPPLDAMSEEEKAQPNLPDFAGEKVDSGREAQVYADEFIALHLESSTEGRTYSELSSLSRENPDDEELKALVQTAFRGETLRGLLLTTYGFSELGSQAELAMTVSFIGAVLLFIFGILGLVHAARTPKEATI